MSYISPTGSFDSQITYEQFSNLSDEQARHLSKEEARNLTDDCVKRMDFSRLSRETAIFIVMITGCFERYNEQF